MTIRVVTPPAAEALTVAEVAEHLRLGSAPYAEQTLLESLIIAARQWVETYTQQAICTQTLESLFPGFPAHSKPLNLRGPVHSIVSVTYLDMAGASKTLDSSPADYIEILDADPPQLVPNVSEAWPESLRINGAVRVRYEAGYTEGESPDTYPMPKAFRAAMLLIIGDLYENREASITGTIYTPTPTVERLLSMYRVGLSL